MKKYVKSSNLLRFKNYLKAFFAFMFLNLSLAHSQIDYSLKFDGTNDYLNAGTFNVSGNKLTLAAWVKPLSFGDDPRIISKTTGIQVQDHYFSLAFDDQNSNQAKIRFRLKTNGTTHQLLTTSLVAAGGWMHVAAVYDGATMKIYVDGALKASMNKSGNIDTNSIVPVWIGGNPPVADDRPYHGFMDDIVVFNKAMTQSQIQGFMYTGIENSDPLYSDLISYWKFSTGYGQYAMDGKNNNKALLGSTIYPDANDPKWSSVLNPAIGSNSYALKFDGVNDYVDAGNFRVSGKELTLTAWFRADEFGTDPRIISKANGVYNQKFQLLLHDINSNTAKIRFRIQGNELTSSATVSAGKWYHVAATYDGNLSTGNMKIYLDGDLVATSGRVRESISNSPWSVWIGGNPNNPDDRPFAGFLDELSVWNTPLSQNEIQAIMFHPFDNTHPKWNNVVSYWKFDDCGGQIMIDEKGDNPGVLGSTSSVDNNDPGCNAINAPTSAQWAGVYNNDANQANNWDINSIPDNTDVSIPPTDNDPVITTDLQVASLTVQSGAAISVPVGKTLTVNGDLVLKADASGSGSIDVDGDLVVTGETKVEKYQIAYKHHYIAAPVNAQNVNLYSDALKFRNYIESSPTWNSIDTGNFELARGYVVLYGVDKLKEFLGTLNLGYTYNTPVTSANYGWNLVGNPYPFVVDGEDFVATNTSGATPLISSTLWFWAEGDDYYTTDYSTWTPVTGGVAGYLGGPVPDGKIAPGQGFFIKALKNGNVEFNKGMKTNGPATFYNAERVVQRAWFRLSNTGDDYNELLISFFDGASMGLDPVFDGIKNKGNWYISFYSILDGKDYAAQAFPPLSEVGEVVVPVGFDIRITGNYTISIKNLERMDEYTDIFLEDKVTGAFVDLKQQDYSFAIAKGQVRDRFLIHFIPLHSVTDPQMYDDNQTVANEVVELENKQITREESSQISIYAAQGSIYVKTSGDYDLPGTLILYDMNGKELLHKEIKAGFSQSDVDLSAGYYILSYVSDLHSEKKKIYLD